MIDEIKHVSVQFFSLATGLWLLRRISEVEKLMFVH